MFVGDVLQQPSIKHIKLNDPQLIFLERKDILTITEDETIGNTKRSDANNEQNIIYNCM